MGCASRVVLFDCNKCANFLKKNNNDRQVIGLNKDLEQKEATPMEWFGVDSLLTVFADDMDT